MFIILRYKTVIVSCQDLPYSSYFRLCVGFVSATTHALCTRQSGINTPEAPL